MAWPGQNPLRADLSYDLDGRVLTLSRFSDVAGQTLDGRTQYGYDDAGRTTSITNRDGSGQLLSQYLSSYDAAGRSLSENDDGGTTPYSFPNTKELAQDGSHSHSYDA